MKLKKRLWVFGVHGLAAGLLLSAVVPAAMAQLQFSGPTYYPVGNSPLGVAAGDFNGDGKQDLAVVNNADQNVGILLGNGDGTFERAVNYPLGSSPVSVAVGDFNRDGKLDLAVSNGLVVSILLGNGDGTFQPHVDYNAGTAIFNIYVADLNGDGKLDLLTIDSDDNSVSALLGNGDGTLQAPITSSMQLNPPFTRAGTGSAIGDFNGDGKIDAVMPAIIANPYPQPPSAYLVVLLGNGDGTFRPLAPMYVAKGGISIASGDFNGDGKTDLAIASSYGIVTCVFCRPPKATEYGRADAYLSNGDGTFSHNWSTGSILNFRPSIAWAVDLNNDGKLDLIGTHGGGSSFMTFIGNGDGTFQPSFSFYDPNPGSFYSALAVGDFNGDTLLDVAVTADDNGGSEVNVVPIFLNTTPSFVLTLTLAGSGSGAITSQPAVINCKTSCTGNFAPGTAVTLTAAPSATSNFAGWSGACSGNGSCTVTMNAAASVTGVFNALFPLSVALAGSGDGSVTSSPTGISCGSTCSASFVSGTMVTLAAAPNATSNFTGWSGACSGMGACSVAMNAATSVTASFNLQDFSLTPASTKFTMQPGGQGTDVITLAGLNGSFTNAIQLTCAITTEPAPMPSCALSATSVTPGANPVTSTLTITAPATAATMLAPSTHRQLGRSFYALLLPLVFGAKIIGPSKGRRRWYWLPCSFLLLLLFLTACGGGGSSNGTVNQGPTNYTVTVTGSSGTIQHTTQVTVTVQ